MVDLNSRFVRDPSQPRNPPQIKLMTREQIEFVRSRTIPERMAIVQEINRLVRFRLFDWIRSRHPDWPESMVRLAEGKIWLIGLDNLPELVGVSEEEMDGRAIWKRLHPEFNC